MKQINKELGEGLEGPNNIFTGGIYTETMYRGREDDGRDGARDN